MLHVTEAGRARVSFDPVSNRGRLAVPSGPGRPYTDAQLDDYTGRVRRRFPDRPGLTLSLRARTSHPAPAGTFGFGFWNDPFSLRGGLLAVPSAVWFFYASPPSDMPLVDDVPGAGWKAATLAGPPWPEVLVTPAGLAAGALALVPGLGRPTLAAARRMVIAREASLDDVPLAAWHQYEISWGQQGAVFSVDGVERLRSTIAPAGPLGLVIWMDNQFAVASRAGQVRFGTCPVPEEQWLEFDALEIQRA